MNAPIKSEHLSTREIQSLRNRLQKALSAPAG